MTTTQSVLERLVRLQRQLGLWPLWLFAAFHMWLHWPALIGRDAWLERASAYTPSALVGSAVVAWLVLYVSLDLVRALRAWRSSTIGVAADSAQNAAAAPARELFQAITTACIAVFVAYHVSQVWPKPAGTHDTLENTYQRLWDQLGQTGPLIVYVLGCAALALHLTLGLWRTLDGRLPASWRTPLVVAVCMLGLWVFVSYLQLVARFATGVPLLS